MINIEDRENRWICLKQKNKLSSIKLTMPLYFRGGFSLTIKFIEETKFSVWRNLRIEHSSLSLDKIKAPKML